MKLIKSTGKEETYLYNLNENKTDLSSTDIEIVFFNGKFDHCDYDFKNPYTEEEWEIIGEISNEIKRLKKTYSK